MLLGLALAATPAGAGPAVAHFFYTDLPPARAALERHASTIGLLSPTWFVVDARGRVASSVDPALVRWAAERRIPLAPVVANRDFSAETARALLRNRERVVGALLAGASTHAFSGLELDVEGLAPEDRGAYLALVHALAKGLHAQNRKLGVAVPAPLAAEPPATGRRATRAAWPRSRASLAFDYRRLAEAADFVSLMAYDQHVAPEQPGPVAGFPWVAASVERSLEWIPRSKLLLGIPLYFREWKGGVVAEGTYAEAREAARRRGAALVMDPAQREKTYSFREDGAEGVVWLEDADTLRERIGLVDRHGLAGFSAWQLGYEDPALWDLLEAGAWRP